MYGECFTGVGGVSVRHGTCAFRISTLIERMETEFNVLLSLPFSSAGEMAERQK
jgi:hypothetical protein